MEEHRESLLQGNAEDQERAQKIALVRVERLYPFPADIISDVLSKYPNRKEVVWCQEEPRNMGAWPMVDEWCGEILGGTPPRYIGRRASASPATGSSKAHKSEQRAIVEEAFKF